MKQELKQKMIGVIGTHSNALIESIAKKCAQVAVDFIEARDQALSMSGVVGRSKQLACEHKFIDNFHGWDGVRKCLFCSKMEEAS